MVVVLLLASGSSSNVHSQIGQESNNTNVGGFDPRDFTGIWVLDQQGEDDRYPGWPPHLEEPPEGLLPDGLVWRPAYHDRVISTDRPPMTEWGRERFEATRTSYGDPWTGRPPAPIEEWNDGEDYCMPAGYPRVMLEPQAKVTRFVQTDDVLVQMFEWHRNWRDIWLDGREPHENPEPRYFGYAVADWEGDTLVVQSYGFHGHERVWLDSYGHPRSEEMRMIERFTRLSRDKLEWDITLIDPVAYEEAWTGTKTFTLTDRSPRSPYEEIREDICVWADLQDFWQQVDTLGAGGELTQPPVAR